MRKKILYPALLALLYCINPRTEASATVITISGSLKASEEREVSDFTGISSSGAFNVIITMGNKESLRLEGDPDAISEIETKVEKGILKIGNKNKSDWKFWKKTEKVTVYITAKSLEKLSSSGSGNITVKGTIKSDRLLTAVSGSGTITTAAVVSDFSASVSGSGGIDVTGSAQNARISVSGSGGFGGKDFKTETSVVQVSGSGGVKTNAEKTLSASVSGSGDIRYTGNAVVTKRTAGSGSISKF